MDQIHEVALELFAMQGFYNTSISQIARKAGVSKGLIYNYFDSKDDLLRHIIEHAFEAGEQILSRHKVPESAMGVSELYATIDEVFDMVKANPNYWKLLMSLSMQKDIVEKFRDEIDQKAKSNIHQVTEILKELNISNPELEALHMGAVLDGILLHYIHLGDQYPLEEMRDFLKQKNDRLLQGSTAK